MELLEREQFLGELEALLSDVASGNGRFVLVSGEAGIGKTSLVERFTEAHKKGARILWGACDALFTPRPLGPLYDIARQAQSRLLALLDEEAPRASIFTAVFDELENERVPAITVIEDVHWADEATLDLLKFLGRRINRTHSMLVVTYRDDEVSADHPLRLILGDLPHRSVARLRLPPLSEAGVDTLAESAGRRIEDLFSVTGGNPFFVTEALASKEPGVPITVSDAVLSRAARLLPASRAVLELVSVVPAKTEMWLLGDTISPDTLKYAPVAARHAAALNAHRESASHYQTALRYADRLAPEEHAGLFEQRSFECYLTDQVEESLQARREALEIWKQLGNLLRQGDNLRWMSRVHWFLGRRMEAERYSTEAVTILESLPPGPELAMAYSTRAQLYMLADENQQAVLWGSRAIELAEKLGATETLVHALNNVGTAELLANNEQGQIKLEESLRLALANDLQDHVSRAYTNLAAATVRARNYRLAMRYLNNGIAYTTEHDIDAFKLYMTVWRARAHFEQGDWDSAADDAALALGHYRVSDITKIAALAVLGHLRVRRGDPDAARLLAEARELAIKTEEPQRIAPAASAQAEFAWLKGDLEQVMGEARSVLEMAGGHDDPWLQGEFAFWMWRAGGALETHEKIAAPYALQMSGDWRAAAEAWREIGCPYEEAMALVDGDELAKRAALEIFERLGAGPAAEKLRQALRATGVHGLPRGPRPSTKENPAGITDRQMEVLVLMADGLSNAEIAERLFISTRTVDHHVSTILAKLDARTRAEAVSLGLQTALINKNRQQSNPK